MSLAAGDRRNSSQKVPDSHVQRRVDAVEQGGVVGCKWLQEQGSRLVSPSTFLLEDFTAQGDVLPRCRAAKLARC